MKIVAATYAGMTVEEVTEEVTERMKTTNHPTTGKPYTEKVFQPMVEPLEYLRNQGFNTSIVSGGGIEFMRLWTEKTNGIPPEQVVGSGLKMKYEVRAGKPVLVKLAEIDLIDDEAGKPIGIQSHIGLRPLLAFGNYDGDFQMLEWTTTGDGPRFGTLVHHTDADREFACDRDSPGGKLVHGLDEGPERGWTMIDMKNDWKEIYVP